MTEASTAPDRPQTLSASTPCRSEDVPSWDLETDVLIVGLGIAGASAALEAAAAGSDVVVLERASAGGGASAESGGLIYLGGGTPVQKACGFEDSCEEMFKYLMAAGGPSDESKVRLYCENSLEHYDWLVGLGLEFKHSFYAEKTTSPETDDGLCYSGNETAYPFSELAKPAPRGHKPKVEGDGGRLIMDKLLAAVEAGPARVIGDALVETLVRSDDGRVIGAVARVDNRLQYIRARQGVVLAAGGFIMNKEMLARHAPALLKINYPNGTDGDDGRGIRMGVAVGGTAIHMDAGFVTTPFYPPASHLKGILVNEQGQRFINEDAYHGRSGHAILHGQGGNAYLIVDTEIYGKTIAFHQKAAVEDSIEDLEAALKLPPASLVHTVEYYNRHAANGEDPLFHKAEAYLRPLTAAPFAAVDCRNSNAIFAGFTFGGLDTLPTGEVLDSEGEVVAGLYAAGRNSAGLPRWGGGYSSGMSLGGSSFFGRMAGKTAAAAGRR